LARIATPKLEERRREGGRPLCRFELSRAIAEPKFA
jgi:hypothetical protein